MPVDPSTDKPYSKVPATAHAFVRPSRWSVVAGRYDRHCGCSIGNTLYRLYLGIADGTPIPAQWTCRRRCRYIVMDDDILGHGIASPNRRHPQSRAQLLIDIQNPIAVCKSLPSVFGAP